MQNIQTELGQRAPIQGWPLGYLMEPMGWAGQQLVRLVEKEPAALAGFFSLSKARMHVIAFVLAHADGMAVSASFEELCRRRLSDLLEMLGPTAPALKGVIKRLPGRVLTPDGYRLILELMADAEIARLLAHGPEIDDRRLKALADTPPELRRVVMSTMEVDLDSVFGLADGLRWLAGRGCFGGYEALLTDLAGREQSRQLIARLKRHVEDLPLPGNEPPDAVGPARRIESPSEVRQIAKAWRNCLVSFQHRIDDGRSVVYRWHGPPGPALALAERHGRFGWFLEQVKGPSNQDLPAQARKAIEDAFSDAGLPPARLVAPLEALMDAAGERRYLD
jgi:hypothetical protein